MSVAYDASAWDPDTLPPPRIDDDLVSLANGSMRARRRPIAVLALWTWQAAFALLIAWPAASAVSAFYGANPSGDEALWTPGGHALGDLLLLAQGSRATLATLTILVFLVAGFADLVPIAALIAAIGYVTRERTAPPFRPLLARGAVAFPTFASLFGAAVLMEGMVAGIAVVVSAVLSAQTVNRLGEARSDQLGWLVGLLVLAGAAVIGVLHDLARAASVRFRVRTIRACRCALTAFLRSPASVLWSWAWRAAAGWAPVAIGALVAARVGGHGGTALVALAVVHQLSAAARVAFRASWLASALRSVNHAHRVVRSH